MTRAYRTTSPLALGADLDADAPQRRTEARVCRHAACQTRLSRYNEGEWCSLHEPPEVTNVDCHRCAACGEFKQSNRYFPKAGRDEWGRDAYGDTCLTCLAKEAKAEAAEAAREERRRAYNRSERRRIASVAATWSGVAVCSACGLRLPATPDFFGETPSGRRKATCKRCAEKHARQRGAVAALTPAGVRYMTIEGGQS